MIFVVVLFVSRRWVFSFILSGTERERGGGGGRDRGGGGGVLRVHVAGVTARG